MTVAASFARQDGFHWVACASTGNTSASMAAYAARGDMRKSGSIPTARFPGASSLNPWTMAR